MAEYMVGDCTFAITEEASKDKSGKPTTLFYIREKPFRAGYSYQSTALTEDAAIWVVHQLQNDLLAKRIKELEEIERKQKEEMERISVNYFIRNIFRIRKNSKTMEFISGLDHKSTELIQKLRPLQKKRLFTVAMEMAVRSESPNTSHTWFRFAKHFW